jgi:hypothetical protein
MFWKKSKTVKLAEPPKKSEAQIDWEEFPVKLEKPHKLRKLFEKQEQICEVNLKEQSSSSAGFFLLLAECEHKESSEIDIKKETRLFVTFAWELNGTYVISKVPLQKIRIKIVEEEDEFQPTVSIITKWNPTKFNNHPVSRGDVEYNMYFMSHDFQDDQESFFSRNLAYVVISCKESDWPKSVNMPLNTPDSNEAIA